MADQPDLRTTLGAVPIQRDVVRAGGPEAVEYLQGQLSQDVAVLADGESRPALLLQPSGKVDAWLRLTRLGDDDLLLDVQQGWGDAVLARLSRFKLRTKVDLDLERWSGLAVRGPGAGDVEAPSGTMALTAAWPGVEAVDLLSGGELALAGVPLVDGSALDALRIECGVPAMGAELTEATIPAEAGAWLIEVSVSFTKGCYTGQELVARVDSRGGNVPRPVRGLLVDAIVPPPGAAVLADGSEVGTVTSAARSAALGPIALAVVGRTTAPGTRVELRWDDGRTEATVAELPLR
ncbi:MAG: YgfZ/GcvT domain-containing protein [Acidimicrobiales bacterium]